MLAMPGGQRCYRGDQEVFDRVLREATDTMGVDLDDPQREKMWAHFLRVTDANQRFNLTRITSPLDAAIKHYADSVSLLAVPNIAGAAAREVLDVGTGAGFPAIPLAIVCTQWHVIAIDGTGKKARFVADTVADLGLANVEVRHARAADLAREQTGRFDLVLLRAVSKLAVGIEETSTLVRRSGHVVFYKTVRIPGEEQAAGDRMARAMGLRSLPPFDVNLLSPDGPIARRFIRYERPA